MTEFTPIIIECGINQDAYKVFLNIRSLSAYHAACELPDVKGKEGESLVAAMLAANPYNIKEVSRCRDFKFNDGPKGEPAYQRFDENGMMIETCHYFKGNLHDGANGEPAYQRRTITGSWVISRYWLGKLNDGKNCEPAVQEFTSEGKLSAATHYYKGKRNDGADGAPASLQFNRKGTKLLQATRYSHDFRLETLGFLARRKVQKQYKQPALK
jgi:hypothetical protein